MAGTALTVFLIAAALYGMLCAAVYFRQAEYVYYPDARVAATPRDAGMDYESLTLETSDGERIAAWFVPAGAGNGAGAATNRVTVLFCHGNAGNIGDRIGSLRTFHDLGWNVLIFDYRGYGDSTGRPDEQGTYLDARACWDYLTGARGLPAGRIVVFGRSLGGAVACKLAEDVDPAALVMESTFASACAMAKRMFPFLPVRLLCRYRYDSLSRIDRVECPVFIAHSVGDEMIPFSHGEALYARAAEPKRFVKMTGGHNSGGLDVDPAYQRALAAFVAEHAE